MNESEHATPADSPSVPTSGATDAPSGQTATPHEETSEQHGDIPADQLASDGAAVVEGLPEDGSSESSANEA